MTNKLSTLFTVICVFALNTYTYAQSTEKSILFQQVEEVKQEGLEFQQVALFTVKDEHNRHEATLSKETLLTPDTKAINSLYQQRPKAISLTIQTAYGTSYTLEGMRSNPLALNPNIKYQDANGIHSFPYDAGLHYQGALANHQHSLAAISVFADGNVMILFANNEGNFVVGKIEDASGDYILYNDRDYLAMPDMPCGTMDDDGTNEEPIGVEKTTAKYQCNKVSVYFEADNDLYNNKNSDVTATQTYLTGMFNEVQTMYRNEQVAVELKSIKIWTTADNYSESSSHAALGDFTTAWNNNGQSFDGDVAMLIARDPGGKGGVAWRAGLCSSNSPYAYGDVSGSFNNVPSYSWDVSMVTHELGHLFTLRHTHWCGWRTGPNNSCGSIDDCNTQESGAGCSTCPSTYTNSAPTSSWQGTVMSYCHLRSRGINLANGFGPLPGDELRDAINTLPCLKSKISAKLTPTAVCKDYGKIELAFDNETIGSKNFGVPAYSYQWSAGNVTTKDIVVVKSGQYTVTVTDGDGCKETFAVTVPQDNSPDCMTTGIDEITNRSYVSLYPNPAKEETTVKFFSTATENTTIKLIDVTGKTILLQHHDVKQGENNITINTSMLSSGVYYIKLSASKTEYQTLKLLIN